MALHWSDTPIEGEGIFSSAVFAVVPDAITGHGFVQEWLVSIGDDRKDLVLIFGSRGS